METAAKAPAEEGLRLELVQAVPEHALVVRLEVVELVLLAVVQEEEGEEGEEVVVVEEVVVEAVVEEAAAVGEEAVRFSGLGDVDPLREGWRDELFAIPR